MTPQEIITLRAPQFSSDARLDDMVTLATTLTGSEYGEQRNYAIALLVMHWMTLEAMRNAQKDETGVVTDSGIATAGGIKSESEGQLSHTFGGGGSEMSNRNPELSSTGWGLELLELRNGTLFLPRNRMMGSSV